MARQPIAFLSYVQEDDRHDQGKITSFRTRLEGEVRMQTGRPFEIFQDRNDLRWGQFWKARIEESLSEVSFLIPVITPSFLKSPTCRYEFKTFLLKEETLGTKKLILPIYYVNTLEIEGQAPHSDEIVSEILSRNWTDWRKLRFNAISSARASQEMSKLACNIRDWIIEIESLSSSESHATSEQTTAPPTRQRRSEASSAVHPPAKRHLTVEQLSITDEDLSVPALRPRGKFDKDEWNAISKPSYYAYTKAYDEVINARELASPDQISELYEGMRGVIRRQSTKGKKEIAAIEADLISKSPQLSQCSVVILVDNSGSMRGKKILNVSACCSVITEALERANVEVEVVGYTTRAWRGGSAHSTWVADGKPKNPGRLNDLRHIIYKSRNDSFLDAADSISVMNKEGLLKENIDGEAIIFAQERLKSSSRPLGYIIVLSDGAPVDDSTLQNNKSNILWDHLAKVVNYYNTKRDVSIHAIGVDVDVSSVYGSGSETMSPEGLSVGALNFVKEVLLDEP